MADLRITNIPPASMVALTDDVYIKTGDTFRRVPVEKLADLFAASGFYKKPAGGIPQTDFEIEDIVISPYGDNFISSMTYSEIVAKETIGVKLAPLYRPEYGIEYRGVTLEVENGAASFAFLIPGDPAYIYVFAVTDLGVSETQIPLSGGSGGASTNAEMGIGIAQCNTPAGTAAKEASMTGYVLVQNGFVAVRFTYSVPASATLSINGQDAKAIYWNGSPIVGDIITGGDIAILVYDGTNYQLVAILPNVGNQLGLARSGSTVTLQKSFSAVSSILNGPWQTYFIVQVDTYTIVFLHATCADAANLQIFAQADVGNTRYSVMLTQAGSSPSYYMTGTLNETLITPAEETVTGATPSIDAEADHIYKCGELTSLTISSFPAQGEFTIIFTSGSTPTVPDWSTIVMPDGFAVEANKRYEINVMDGYATAGSWGVNAS